MPLKDVRDLIGQVEQESPVLAGTLRSQDADQILVLDGGRVTASGTHARLMGEGGLYAHLARTQLLPAAKEEDARTS